VRPPPTALHLAEIVQPRHERHDAGREQRVAQQQVAEQGSRYGGHGEKPEQAEPLVLNPPQAFVFRFFGFPLFGKLHLYLNLDRLFFFFHTG